MDWVATFNWYDWVVVALLFYSVWGGLRSGLSGELVMTIGLVLMIGLAAWLFHPAGNWLTEHAHLNHDIADLVAFVGIALVVYVIALTIRQILRRKMKTGLFSSLIENIGGVVAGLVRMLLLLGALSVGLCLLPSEFWHEQVGRKSRFGSFVVERFPSVKESLESKAKKDLWFLKDIKRREVTEPEK